MTAILVFICILFSFFFSGMETGVLLINGVRIRYLKEKGSFGARILLNFLHRPDRLSSTVLVGNTLVNTIATILVAHYFLERDGVVTGISATILFAFILWYFCELIPKALFRRFPNRLSTRLAPGLFVAYLCFWPIIQVFSLLSQGMIRVLGGKTSARQMFVTREELKWMSQEVEKHTPLSGEQRNLVASILDGQNATAKDVMQSGSNVVTLKTSATKEEVCRVAAEKILSRFPAYSDEKDERWEGVRVVYDILFQVSNEIRHPPRLETNLNLQEVLSTLRKARSPMGFVRNKEGKDVGIITVEDVLRKYLGKLDL